MTAWQQLDDSLGRLPTDSDSWSDHGVEQAISMVQGLTPAGFTALQSAWRHRPLAWQVQCAQILPWAPAPPQEIVPVLLEMARSPDEGLTFTAADTLREYDPALVAPGVTPDMGHRLRDIARRHPGPAAMILQRLLDDLAKNADAGRRF